MKEIAIIDYGAGNIQSIKFALQRLGVTGILLRNPEEIRKASHVIFPGVGEASSAMAKLKATGLDKVIPTLTQPVLGICLGMQLMCTSSEEGPTEALDIFPLEVTKFDTVLKVPQIGWNQVSYASNPLFNGVDQNAYFYLVHSYYVPESDFTIARSTYGISYSTGLQKDNFFGVQFHPEKSGSDGAKLLQNFVSL